MTRNDARSLPTAAIREYRELSAPATGVAAGGLLFVFAWEVWTAGRAGAAFATGLFGVAPVAAWVLAPFLHAGLFHLGSSVLGLLLVGVPVETRLGTRRFAGLLALLAYGSTYVGAVVLAAYSGGAIAVYGASGVVYGLAGAGLVLWPADPADRRAVDLVAYTVGLLSVALVAADLLLAPYAAVGSVNGGHVGGLAIGVGAGWWWRRCGRPVATG